MMGLRHSLCVLLIMCFSVTCVAQTLTFRDPPDNKYGHFIKELLVTAYSRLGYEVTFIELIGVREMPMASQNQIDGVLARVTRIESKYPDLLRVPHALFSFDMYLIGDRRRCGFCLEQSFKTVGYSRGMEIARQYAEQHLPDAKHVTLLSSDAVAEMVEKDRFDVGLVMNFDLEWNTLPKSHLIKHKVQQDADFHYLAPKHQDLVPKIAFIFSQMELSGELARLRDKHQIAPLSLPISFDKKAVKAVTAQWQEIALKDGSGVYWQTMAEIFNDSVITMDTQDNWVDASAMFSQKKADILIGAYRGEFSNALYSELHIDYDEYVVGVFQPSTTLEDIENPNKDLSVCIGPNFDSYYQHLDRAKKIFGSYEQCIEQVRAGKADIFLTYDDRIDTDQLKDLANQVVRERQPLFVIFEKSQRGEMLKQYFDKRMQTLYESGRLQAIYGEKYYHQAHFAPAREQHSTN